MGFINSLLRRHFTWAKGGDAHVTSSFFFFFFYRAEVGEFLVWKPSVVKKSPLLVMIIFPYG